MKKLLAFVVAVPTLLVSGATAALAQAADPSTTVGGAAGTIKDEIMETGVAVLPYAALIVALVIAWRFARRFVKA